MKTIFEMALNKTPENMRKTEALCAFDIMMDDPANPLPDKWHSYWNAEAGDDMVWGTKVRVTLEVIQ